MSRLSQFFSGSTSGFIEVEVFILSGGGGGGSNGPGGSPQGQWAGSGGGGAVYYGVLQIAPGTTCPIIIGAGGAGNTNHLTTLGTFHGAIGGFSAFNTPTGCIRVAGGGGGAGSFDMGTRGGCSGGDHGSRPLIPAPPGGSGSNAVEVSNGGSWYSWGGDQGSFSAFSIASGGSLIARNGSYHGYNGGGGANPTYNHTGGGGAGGGGYGNFGGKGVFTHMEGYDVNSFRGNLYGMGGGSQVPYFSGDGRVNQGEGGISAGANIRAGKNGSSGVVIINYPRKFGASSISGGGSEISFKGSFSTPASDFTNSTYGVRGYRFTSSGSITFP